MSPTQRSLAYLKARGWHAAVVERWNPHARKRQDLFGILDLIALAPGQPTLGLQVTSATNLASRQHKIESAPITRLLLQTGWQLQVHGWRKPTPRRRTWALTARALTPSGWVDVPSTPARRFRDPAPGNAPVPGPGGAGPLVQVAVTPQPW